MGLGSMKYEEVYRRSVDPKALVSQSVPTLPLAMWS